MGVKLGARVVERCVVIPEGLAGRRLDAALAELLPDYSRSLIKTWIDSGQVTREDRVALRPRTAVAAGETPSHAAGNPGASRLRPRTAVAAGETPSHAAGNPGASRLRPRTAVAAGETYAIHAELSAAGSVAPEPVAFELAHADPHLIVVNKPAGLVVHPGAGNPGGTLQNGLLYRFPELAAVPRFGLVHRLDAGTTGLLLVARTAAAHQRLTQDLLARRIQREYRAITRGCPVAGGTIDEPLGRHPRDRLRMAVRAGGRRAITHYRVLARFPRHSFLAVRLETGRTHQVRAHLAHLGYPLAGDFLYARGAREFGRPALHARALRLAHPGTGAERVFFAPLPGDMAGLLARLAEEERDWDGYSWNG